MGICYKNIADEYEDEKYLINMISARDVVRFGSSIGLNEESCVLDLCCGYGTMLKIWREAFDVSAIGVDRDKALIDTGRARISDSHVSLICSDVISYSDDRKYDVVVCTELSYGLFGSFNEGVAFMEQFLKPNGVLVFGKLFSEIPCPPKELTEFDGDLPILSEISNEAENLGYIITSMISGNMASWERYIMRDSKLSLEALRRKPNNKELLAWAQKWQRMYFDYRRRYENWGLFGMERKEALDYIHFV